MDRKKERYHLHLAEHSPPQARIYSASKKVQKTVFDLKTQPSKNPAPSLENVITAFFFETLLGKFPSFDAKSSELTSGSGITFTCRPASNKLANLKKSLFKNNEADIFLRFLKPLPTL